MKATITAVLMMLVVGVIVQQVSAYGIISVGEPGSFTTIDTKRMEAKMTEALKNLAAKPQVRAASQTDSADGSLMAPINNSSLLDARNTESTINSEETDLGIDDDLSSLESSAASIAAELESIKSETSSLDSFSNRSSSESNLAANNLSTSAFNASMLISTFNLTEFNATQIDSSLNSSALDANINSEANLTDDNLTASYAANGISATNSTGLDLSANNSLGSNKVDPTQSGQNRANEQIGGSISGAINGFWGIQSSQHQMGRKDIDSRTFLSGGFEVDKSVKFSDRGV